MIKNLSGRESLTKILNVDESKCKDKIKHIFQYPEIPDYLYRILIVSRFGKEKANRMLNQKDENPDIDKGPLGLRRSVQGIHIS